MKIINLFVHVEFEDNTDSGHLFLSPLVCMTSFQVLSTSRKVQVKGDFSHGFEYIPIDVNLSISVNLF